MTSSQIKIFELRSCCSKKKYSTLKDALQKLFEYRAKNIEVDSIYKCVFCNQYHVGHYSKTRSRRQNRKVIRYILQSGVDI